MGFYHLFSLSFWYRQHGILRPGIRSVLRVEERRQVPFERAPGDYTGHQDGPDPRSSAVYISQQQGMEMPSTITFNADGG